MAVTIQVRRDTAANWTSANPVLHQGEPGLETDTGNTKIGDGSTAWASLAYHDLPLSQLDSRYAEKSAAANAVYYVSAAAGASDSNDGLSWGSAKATIAGALTALGSNAGTIQLSAGTFTISAADGNGNGVSLAQAGTVLRGAGFTLTTVSIQASVTWAVEALAAHCTIADLYILVTSSGLATYGCGVSTPGSSGSCEHCTFDNILVGYNGTGTMTAAFAIGPDHPGSGSLDIAWTELRHCYFNGTGTITAGFQIGNGTAGNILATTAVGCAGGPAAYGVKLAGSGVTWIGGGFEACTTADITVTQGQLEDPMVFVGTRSENASQVLNAGYIGPVAGMTLIGYIAAGYSPPGGSNIITWNAGGPLAIQGGNYSTAAGTTAFAVNTSHGTPAVAFSARDVVTDSTSPYPAASAYIQRSILNAQTTNGGTTAAEPLAGYVAVIDAFTVPGIVTSSGEVAISSATTMTSSDYGLMHACTVASAYTVTLPTPVSVPGTQIGVRVVDSSAALLTLATAAGTVDGASTRIMWAGESAILESDGSKWVKIGGKTVPMCGVMSIASAGVSVSTGTVTNLPLTTTITDNTGRMCSTTNTYITAQRTNTYMVIARVEWSQISSGNSTRTITAAYINGSGSTIAAQDERYAAIGGYPCITASGPAAFTAGNYCTLSGYQTSSVSNTANYATSSSPGAGTMLSLTEIPSW